MTDIDTLRQAEQSGRATVRAAVLAGDDTATARLDLRRTHQRIKRAIAKLDDDEQARQQARDSAAAVLTQGLIERLAAAMDAKLAHLKPPAPVNQNLKGIR